MSFRFDELRDHFAASVNRGRMGHAYLLTGDRSEELENLALGLAAQILGNNPADNPDFHSVRPQSKSRRITVEQMRQLEKQLHLHAYKAEYKIAAILEAERMCLGDAAAANAFLKTLEEPPAHTLIFLTSSRPAVLLPTILSRCLRLDMGFTDIPPHAGPPSEWISRWMVPHTSPRLRAYARAQILMDHWQDLREQAESHLKEHPDFDDDSAAAWLESEYQLARQESIAQLQRWYWHRSATDAKTTLQERLRAVRALEDLQAALAQNIEQNLSVERNCLFLEGVV